MRSTIFTPSYNAAIPRRHRGAVSALAILLLTLLLPACATKRFKESADREVYGIIETKSADVPGMTDEFTIEAVPGSSDLTELPVNDVIDPALGETGADESGATVLSLEKSLALAVTNSRTYQNRKEALYLEALSLTLDRHRYQPVFSADAGGEYSRTTSSTTHPTELSKTLGVTNAFIDDLEAVTGTPADLLNAYAAVVKSAGDVAGLTGTESGYISDRSVSGGTSAGVNWLLKGGGRIAVDLTSNFLRFLTGDSESLTSSVLSASVTQPLLRGAGAKVSAERLTQAERDVLYALRDFSRFRQQFTVQVCSSYYGVLQNLDAVHNNWSSLENFRRNAERERDFATEGRSTLASVGRQEAAELSAENRWINSVRNYRENLDLFKILIGLSTHSNIVLDTSELDELRAVGLRHPNIQMDDAVKVAFNARLDLYTERDRVEDANRAIAVARNALLPEVNLVASGAVRSQGDDNFQQLDFRRANWSAGLDAKLPLDRKAERNAFRTALIQGERVGRDLSLAEDTISLDVRSAWRNLESARRNFLVAQKSVDLNMRRVEEQELLADLGRGSVLDQVDSQNELTQSQNELTASLISHTLARLQFWLDMGILYIKDDGQWEEVSDDYQQQP